jgi:hypothetical protein
VRDLFVGKAAHIPDNASHRVCAPTLPNRIQHLRSFVAYADCRVSGLSLTGATLADLEILDNRKINKLH